MIEIPAQGLIPFNLKYPEKIRKYFTKEKELKIFFNIFVNSHCERCIITACVPINKNNFKQIEKEIFQFIEPRIRKYLQETLPCLKKINLPSFERRYDPLNQTLLFEINLSGKVYLI